MEAGNAHPDPSRERRDTERPVVLLAQDLDRLGDPASAPADRGDLAEPVALVALREPVHDLAHREGCEHAEVVGRIGEPDDPQHRVEQLRIELAHRQRAHHAVRSRGEGARLDQDRRDHARFEHEPNREVGARRRGRDHVSLERHPRRDQEVVIGVVPISPRAEEHLLAPLGDDAERRNGDPMVRSVRDREPIEEQAGSRLDDPIRGQ